MPIQAAQLDGRVILAGKAHSPRQKSQDCQHTHPHDHMQRMQRRNALLPTVSRNEVLQAKKDVDQLYRTLTNSVSDFVSSLKLLR